MKVLIVDDEKHIRESVKRYMELEHIPADCAENGISAQRMLQNEVYDAAVVDLKMPGLDGLGLLKWIQEQGLRIPVLIISAHGDVQDAVEAMKLGALDYIVKPFDPEELIIRLKRVLEDKKRKDQLESGKRINIKDNFIGSTRQMEKIKNLIDKIAPTPSTVLITGESGSGKEVAARRIHTLSNVADGPFVGVNIGGLPENLIESELFGYEKGAFTGAVTRKPGMFELASSGTLFLDEIGDMPLHLQVKLLRALQERKITRLGGTQNIPVNARIIAATNRDLTAMMEEGTFREDLYYRLNVVTIELPPLRKRKEDIPLITGHLIEKLNVKMGCAIESVDPAGLEKLKNYNFPGNIRELENILERAFIFAEENLITADDIAVREKHGAGKNSTPSDDNEVLDLKSVEKKYITKALRRWEGNRTKAAEELGITRRSILNKIKEYQIDL